MNLSIDDIKRLISVPKEYISNPKAIEYLYQINSNIFNNVNEYLYLSYKFQEKLVESINNKLIILTSNNIKLLNSLYQEFVINILNNHFDYLNLLNKNNFDNIGIVMDNDFINLLEKNQTIITEESPYLVTLCSDYIIKQYVNDKVSITTIMPYFINWHEESQIKLIQEYLKKDNTDLSIFYVKNNYDNKVPYFKDIIVDIKENNMIIRTNNIN